jgi:DNA-binding response OmpR family regulator
MSEVFARPTTGVLKTHSPSFHLLIVEDDKEILFALKAFLEMHAYTVDTAADGEEGLSMIRAGGYDLIILDVMLPKLDGFEVLRNARVLGIETPVLMLTARGEQENMLKGFDLGVEDYVIKPFSADLLAARLKAILRRKKSPANKPMDIHRFGDVEVNFSSHEAYHGADPIELTAQEYELLRYLLENRNQTISRDQLLRDVWGLNGDLITRTVDRHVAALRKKVEPDPANPVFIETVYGRGYRFRL